VDSSGAMSTLPDQGSSSLVRLRSYPLARPRSPRRRTLPRYRSRQGDRGAAGAASERAEHWAASQGARLGSTSFVFSRTIDGERPLDPANVTAAFRRVCERQRVTGVRLHDLRHAHATQLLAAGVPVRTVSGRLGHANAMTTLNVYAHALEESDERAAQVIGEIVD
jgi:integrase